jgi:DNA polymerase elongation subunit (family B)
MAVYLQPCDWIESDSNFKYVVDVFGRTNNGDIATLRIKGFQPYFYLKAVDGETGGDIVSAVERVSGKRMGGLKVTPELKLDAMRGFAGLKPVKVWKISCPALWMFKVATKTLKGGMKIKSRDIELEDIYESNLPPFIRLFHERDISPASPITFPENVCELLEGCNVDVAYDADCNEVTPYSNINIPLLVGSYDLEVYSDSGQFPVSSNPKDEITQIGISFRWSDALLETVARYVFVVGTVTPSTDPSVTFIGCKTEKDLLIKFQTCILDENPDILCGYNTFGFDDAYIAERAQRLNIDLQFGRIQSRQWGDEINRQRVKTEKKTFELASGKFAVRYIDMPGRLGLDLYLSMRREQNLDSYKLDNIASTFLRDKVVKFERLNDTRVQLHTKSTRGLFVGNLVRLDVVTNTRNPYKDGFKFPVVELTKNTFVIETADSFEGVDIKKLEWSFAKDDVDHHDIFASHKGSADDRANIAKYCIQDCDLVLTLMAKLDTLVNARGMADVCRVPIQYIFLRGQGIKIYSAVVYNASKRNQIIMTQENDDSDTGYEGAIVLPPKIGMYLDQPIPVLDFNSLYPSNMIAYNLSPDTLVYVKEVNAMGKTTRHDKYGNADGFKVDDVMYDIKDADGKEAGRVYCGFAQPNENPLTIGLLPLTLDLLLKKRKETRKMMEATEDDAQKSVLNGLQLAYKVVANSVYGQCGSKTSPIRRLEVAACTTAVGRQKIYDAKKIVEEQFGGEVIYGDSVASYTPVLIDMNGIVTIKGIEDLGNLGEWKTCSDSDKEYCELENIKSWTENGWTPVERIIRHKLASHKKMVRVLTHTGLVDVTDDHSLLKPDGTEVSSKYLKVGDALLHASYPAQTATFMGCDVMARIAGFFVGDGSCGVYDCPSGKKASWALNNANLDLLETYKKMCKKVYPEFGWIINPTLVSSGVYKLTVMSKSYGSLIKFIHKFREMYYVGNRKNIPDWILNGTLEVKKAFWDGLYDSDGDKDMNGYVRIDQKNQITCAQISLLASRLGYSVSINTRTDKPDICRITCTTGSQRRPACKIKKMHEIPYSGFVYDLTTSSHHFQAGVGQMIVHNTDSIFIKFPTKDLQESMDIAKEAAAAITASGRKAHKIEYEKTFLPFIMFCRKRYVGMMYEDDVKKCKRKEMGIALKRRDSAPIVKDVFGGALDILMEDRDIRKAQKFVQDILVQVMQNKMPLNKFILTKQLGDNYKIPDQMPHVMLAKRMIARDPGSAPQVGDRIPYMFVMERKTEKKQGDKIEHLDYVRKHNLTPDAEFYVTNQIKNPVAQMFALALEQLEGYKPNPKISYTALFHTFMDDLKEDGKSDVEAEEEATLKVLEKKERDIEDIMFTPLLKKFMRGPMDMFVRR